MKGNRPLPVYFGLFVSLILPFTLPALHMPLQMYMVMKWGLVLLLILIVLFWEGRNLDSMGFRKPSWGDLIYGFLGFVVGVILFVITSYLLVLFGLKTTSPGILRIAEIPFSIRVLMVLTAGITEEILFRGYPIERLYELTGNMYIAAFLPWLAFTLLHVYFWGVGGAIQIGVWSIVITLLYIWRRSILACMTMHILNDAYAFLLLPYIMGL